MWWSLCLWAGLSLQRSARRCVFHDARGGLRRGQFAFWKRGYSTYTESQPDGTAFTYAGVGALVPGLLLSITNPAGAIVTLLHDSSHRVTSVTDPVGRPTSFSYDPTSGNITSIQDPFGAGLR